VGLLLIASTSLLGLVVAAFTIKLPDVTVLRAWIMSFGPLAPAAFVVGYALIVPTPVPKNLLNALAGAAFGTLLGIPLVLAGATMGAMLAFGIARVLGRDVINRIARGHLDRADAAVERHGILAAIVIRFIPVLPFTLLNYACGVTSMRFRHYAFGTTIGLIPGTGVMVILASSGARVSLWVPAIISVALGVLSLGAAILWPYRSHL
jgi:uncharacterized membrane protein YdjX (TVP38/TMEM64 family)